VSRPGEETPGGGIIGHAGEMGLIRGAIAGGRLAHSFIFAGLDGIGKRRVAFETAAALNCASSGLAGLACWECGDCERVRARTHPNVLYVEPEAGLIKIDRVREVQAALKYRVERGRKVVVVEAADKLNAQAANAFLKTLEEPPPATVIILVTSRPSELLPTVLSRCQRINFRPLSVDEVAGYLTRETGAKEAEARSIARMSGGSIARAACLLEDGMETSAAGVIEAISAISPGEADKAVGLAEELAKRDDLEEVLESLKGVYRDMGVAAEGLDALVAKTHLPERRAPAWTAMPPWEAFSLVEEARRNTTPPRYMNRQLTIETMLLRLTGCNRHARRQR